jgi:hypothetical protein
MAVKRGSLSILSYKCHEKSELITFELKTAPQLPSHFRRNLLRLVLCSLFLFGCQFAAPKPILPPSTPSEPTPNSNQTMIETIKPSNPTPTLSPTSFPTFIPATAYPIQKISTPEGSSYPAPVYALTPVPDASPFSDCDRTPGIIACDPTAPRLAGHIAFYDWS